MQCPRRFLGEPVVGAGGAVEGLAVSEARERADHVVGRTILEQSPASTPLATGIRKPGIHSASWFVRMLLGGGSQPFPCTLGAVERTFDKGVDRDNRGVADRRATRPGSPLRAKRDAADPRLPGPTPGVASALLRSPRDVLPGSRSRRWGDDEPSIPGRHQPTSCRGGSCTDRDGDHLVHGQGVRCTPESSGQHRLRPAQGLSVAARARLHRGPAGRRHTGGTGAPRHHQRLGEVRKQLSGSRLFGHGCILDGASPHRWVWSV